jgi:hypothetical protein
VLNTPRSSLAVSANKVYDNKKARQLKDEAPCWHPVPLQRYQESLLIQALLSPAPQD